MTSSGNLACNKEDFNISRSKLCLVHTNKSICGEVDFIPTKFLRNKTEEQEHRDNYVTAVSVFIIEVGPDTKEMLKLLEFEDVKSLNPPPKITTEF
uniref:Uncharacterized protein n=1 Tax=Megaselia scalaris TaxID=36166 RepID=T1GY24_MEGSC